MKRRVLLITVILVLTIQACAQQTEQDTVPSLTAVPATVTLLPTQTPSPTLLPTEPATLTSTVTSTPSATQISTPGVLALPTATRGRVRKKQSATVSPTATETLTLEPSPTDTVVSTTTFCPLPTPEPLWVDPVLSPTDQQSQVITVHVGNANEVTITTESGSFTVTGSFGFYANPALVEITLLPNTVHHLVVNVRIQPPPNYGCTYGSYTLQTTYDRNGSSLIIVQGTPVP